MYLKFGGSIEEKEVKIYMLHLFITFHNSLSLIDRILFFYFNNPHHRKY